jgi:UDP-glucose 4-epimerase
LVTGGAGFIGSWICETLLAAGHFVRVIDDLSSGVADNLPSAVDLIEADLLDQGALERAMAGVDGVFHQAARPSVPRSVEDPRGSHRANATGTLEVLLAAREAGAKVVYAGSSSAYGDTQELPKHEDMGLAPQSPYAADKVAGELYARVCARVYGVRTVTLRYFNVFGPRQRADSPYSGVIAKFCMNALNGDLCTVHGDGEQSRDFTFVRDVAHGNLLAMEADCPPGAVINLAGGNRYSLLDMLDELERLVGHPIERSFTATRAGDVKHSQAAVEKAAELLGFRAQTSFADGLRETLDWYRNAAGNADETSVRSQA